MASEGTHAASALDRISPLLDDRRIADGVIHRPRLVNGYVDVLPDSPEDDSKSLAQRTMEFPLLAPIYEHIWRPAGALAFMGFNLQHFREERAKTVRALQLSGNQTVLDIACGPGNFTANFADALSPRGLAIGLDISRPMLRKAVETNSRPNTVYLRGDATSLPFPDATLDAVTCYAALYLIPDPFTVLDEMTRVLKPGGRISVMASRASEHPAIRRTQRRVLGLTGLRMFDVNEFTDYFRSSGLTEIAQEIHGVVQYVHASKPTG
ncbi:methyltransferase domain-containing protein [Hoyosella altamirensis]|uniref:Ubiquinone/menaquinone biosynthesis C-methylase UbiE n=1 Tax=Hoyosella altamirensis TaxID=616997 RepID=A0A839RNB2_9ACTN|nr:methyltransferase domain-containing protein [Hoyosella altamirensis]MBB3037877.1 ubiquinone/menaquinone biosynthesis C-methylase UbiE [Hoyosella altamirensis]